MHRRQRHAARGALIHSHPVAVAARSAASLAAGAAVAWAFPPHNAVWLMPLGLAALMLVLRGRGLRAGFGYGWLFGFAFMLALMPWLRVIGLDAWIALGVGEGFFYAVMGLCWAAVLRHRWWPVGVAACWVGAEQVRGLVPFGGLPWGRLAFGLVDTPVDRYGRLGGTGLISFVVVLAVALAVDAVLVRRALTRVTAAQAAVAVALVACSPLLPLGLDHPTRTVTVASVQGNVQGVGLHSFSHRLHVLNNHVVATERLAARVRAGKAPQPDFVLWPENASDIDPFDDAAARAEIERAVHAIGVPILVGVVLNGPGPNHVQNVGLVWSPHTGPGERYVKQHLVPFGEYIPFRSILTKYISELRLIPRDFAPGHRVGRLDIAGVPVGDLICFEVAYDGLTRGIVDHGAQLIVIQTNNADYVDTGQLDQQFAMSRYRAIETGRQVVIASTDGITGFVSGSGTVQASGPRHAQFSLDRTVRLADGITWGVRFGFAVDVVLTLLGLALAVLACWARWRSRGRMAA